jgi:hypothetical protein
VCSHVFEFTSCRSSSVTCMGMDVSTTVISFAFFDIFMALSIDASSSLVLAHFSFMLTLILLGVMILQASSLSLPIVSSLVPP